uniref:Myb/SANT-like domain-containing protein n=1 Tax=Setaria italica TaxID=4555 RepID=K3XPX9_SETIT
MSTSQGTRTAWSYTYEKGLVDVMKEHVNIPMYRAQNSWTAEGWRNITNKFNDMFPTTHFTKQQVQEKEKELKGSYKIIKEARKSEPKGWKKLIKDNHKVPKFRKKPFLLYNNLDYCMKSIQNCHEFLYKCALYFIQLMSLKEQYLRPEVQSAPPYLNLEEQQSASGKKCKQSQMVAKLGEFIDLRKIQMEKNQEKLDEKKKKEYDYSVEKYIVVVDSIEDLTIEQKADANELFQSEMNRQIFMMAKNQAVRLVWLKKKIHRYVCLS